ncbi:MAG: hypothetical protein GXO32_05205 [Crenarchaeota archaeon]|nr:hypothetical protein [Thermoproteota archaeon]
MSFEIPVSLLLYAQLPKILEGQEVNLEPIINAIVMQKLLTTIVATLPIPTEFKPIIDLMITMEQVKALTAALRGETYTPNIDKIISLVVTLSMMEQLTKAFATAA